MQYLDSDKVHTIHRLDRATSGVVLFAQHAEAARQLADLFATRRIRKHYIALVRGIAPQMGYLDHPVPREPKGKERVEAQSSLRRNGSCHQLVLAVEFLFLVLFLFGFCTSRI